MFRRLLILTLAILLCISPVAVGLAQDTDMEIPQGDLSRGDFAMMLCAAAGFEDAAVENREDLPEDLDAEAIYAKAVMKLVDEEIMLGTSAETTIVNADAPISGTGALVLVGRTLGFSEGPDLHSDLVLEGIAEENMDLTGRVSSDLAESLLANAFGTHSQVKEFLDKVGEKNAPIKSIRMKSDMIMHMTASPELGLGEGPLKVEAKSESAISLKDKVLHQIVDMDMAEVTPEAEGMRIEQYIDEEYIYTSIPEGGWMKMKSPIPMVFDEEFMERQMEVNKGMEEDVHYRLLDTEEIEGEEVYKIGFYSRIGDMDKILKQLGADFDASVLETLKESTDMIKSMGMKGIQWIGVEDGLVRKADMDMAMELQINEGQFVSVEMSMIAHYYDYDADISIEIPQEARDAKSLEELMEEADQQMEVPDME